MTAIFAFTDASKRDGRGPLEIVSALIVNALIIPALIPLALKGVRDSPIGATALLV